MKKPSSFLLSALIALGLGVGNVAWAQGHGHGHHSGGGHHGGLYGGHHGGDYGSYDHHGHLGFWFGGYPSYYGYDYGSYDGCPPEEYPRYYGSARVYRGRANNQGGAGSLAAEVQSALARLRYYGGPIDGIIGSGTRRALRNFQSEAGLPVTGRIDRRTLAELEVG